MKKFLLTQTLLYSCIVCVMAQQRINAAEPAKPNMSPEQIINVNGVFPHLSIIADHEGRSESGIGALLPWANKLWMVGYVAHIHGSGIGLYEINDDMTARKHPESVTGTYANRMVHDQSLQAIIGPHIIDRAGNVRTFKSIQNHRLTVTMEHIYEPDTKVYFLTMEGLLFEANVFTLETKQLFDLVKELQIPLNTQPHFKGGATGHGKIVVANNTYDELGHLETAKGGVLAEYDGKKWVVLSRDPHMEVSCKVLNFTNADGSLRPVYGNAIFASGWDKRSAFMKVYYPRKNEWQTYRLPRGSHAFDHTWNTEWMRIREAQTERYIMDLHGLFYELPIMTYEDKVWGVKPISYHLRIVPDFCFWRGMFVLAGDQTDRAVGQPQSNLLFENIDNLWNYGKPQGWGALWWNDQVKAGEYSDMFLMTGFDKKVVHLHNAGKSDTKFEIVIDFAGNGQWVTYATLPVKAGAYTHHVFPDGFQAHWVRVKSTSSTVANVHFMYN